MNEERDRFLTGAMGACWHEFDLEKPVMTYSLVGYVCTKCGNFMLANNDFSGPEDFPKFWKWAGSQAALKEFVEQTSKGLAEGSIDRGAAADGIYSILTKVE